MSTSATTNSSGCGCLGSVIAAVLSAALNHSFPWGVLHFFLSWVYVLYALIVRHREIAPALGAFFSP